MAQGKKYIPNDKDRAVVEALAGYGIPQAEIARHLKMDKKTLFKYFRNELEEGPIKANASVVKNLHRMASIGNNVAASIFWCKTRLGWREVERIEMTDGDGKPFKPTLTIINKK